MLRMKKVHCLKPYTKKINKKKLIIFNLAEKALCVWNAKWTMDTLEAFFPEIDLLKWACVLYARASCIPSCTVFQYETSILIFVH